MKEIGMLRTAHRAGCEYDFSVKVAIPSVVVQFERYCCEQPQFWETANSTRAAALSARNAGFF
jgi:hypothetical protein